MTTLAARNIQVIAAEIQQKWQQVYYGAAPYLMAMHSIRNISDSYYEDSAESIVNYFLANANTWRGEDARRIKAELKGMLPKR